jgi:hypothetical protein
MCHLTFSWEGSAVKRFFLAGFAVVLACCEIFFGSQSAKAAVLITSIDYTTDLTGATGWTNLASSSTSGASFTGPLTIVTGSGTVVLSSATLASNTPGTPPNSNLLGSAFTASGTGQLLIAYGSINFTQPLSNPAVFMSTFATINASQGTASLSATSYANNANQIIPAGPVGSPTGGENALSPISVATNIPATNGSAASGGPLTVTTLTGTGSPAVYALDELLNITLNSATASISLRTNINVPEPASIVLVGFGAVGMIGYGWKRRKVVMA